MSSPSRCRSPVDRQPESVVRASRSCAPLTTSRPPGRTSTVASVGHRTSRQVEPAPGTTTATSDPSETGFEITEIILFTRSIDYILFIDPAVTAYRVGVESWRRRTLPGRRRTSSGKTAVPTEGTAPWYCSHSTFAGEPDDGSLPSGRVRADRRRSSFSPPGPRYGSTVRDRTPTATTVGIGRRRDRRDGRTTGSTIYRK